MRDNSTQGWQVKELVIPVSVFLILVIYTYGILFVAPSPGFYFNSTTGRVEEINSNHGETPALQVGDQVIQIGPLTWDEYLNNRRAVPYEGVQKGDIVEITVIRDGEKLVIPWEFAGLSWEVFLTRFFNIWWLAFFFWLSGSAAQLMIRPKDMSRRLFIAANYLSALWLIFGSLSSRRIWESNILLHASTWLILPVYLHLHWVFPRPLKELPKSVWRLVYVAGFLLASMELFQLLDRNVYAFGFLLALVGSIVLQIFHYWTQPDQRRSLRLLAVSIIVAFGTPILLVFFAIVGNTPPLAPLALFAMPFMPLIYFYVIYSHQSGGLKIRLNRFLSLYAFLILFGFALLFPIIPLVRNPISHEQWLLIIVLASFATGIAFLALYPRFQVFFDQRFLGIKLPYQNLPETYSSRIAASDDLANLLALLENEVFPSLLIRQYAFLQAQDKILNVLLSKAVPNDSFDFGALTEKAGRYLPNLPPDEDWLRLILPLKVGNKTLGFWLLGRRDPDDLYPQVEIPILQSLADQTAIALSNIVYSDRLRNFYQAGIEGIENERKRISRDLHDDVLNKLADMRNRLGQSPIPPSLNADYEDLKKRLREIINNLHPPMLDQGLNYAIREMVDDLREKHGSVNIILDIQPGADRLPARMEEHLFYIVHEACANALKHSNPRTLTISGVISAERADLSIQDDGKGFDSNADFDTLLANRHYGLAHMKERAHLIGAEMVIRSNTNEGTKIFIIWQGEKKE